jgi:hypothetical protein
MVSVISREAHASAKGPRLQRLRAVLLLLSSIETHKSPLVYAAVESLEDVSIVTATSEGSQEYFEEDKNYGSGAAFSLNSKEVKNALVSFIDIYFVKWRESQSLAFGFYTTANIAKEKMSALLQECGITLPDKPLLELLRDHQYSNQNASSVVKKIVESEYSSQYKNKRGAANLGALSGMSLGDFENFLDKIYWHFGEGDEEQLKEEALNAIRNSRLYSHKVDGKEEVILSLLMDMFDERQSLPDYTQRFIFGAEVQLAFVRAESEGIDAKCDPAGSMWNDFQAPDKRNLSEKISAVCPEYPGRRLKHLARVACRSRCEAKASGKDHLSIRYRIFESCEGYLSALPSVSAPVEAKNVDDMLCGMRSAANQAIGELKKTYSYGNVNDLLVEGVIYELIDSCFLSFDGVQDA